MKIKQSLADDFVYYGMNIMTLGMFWIIRVTISKAIRCAMECE